MGREVPRKGFERAKNGTVEGSIHGVWPEKGYFEVWAPEEGAEDPRELGTDEGVSGKPREEGDECRASVRTNNFKGAEEVQVRHRASEGDERSMDEEGEGVRQTGIHRIWRRGVIGQKEGDGGKGTENKGKDGKAHQLREEGLAKAEPGTK